MLFSSWYSCVLTRECLKCNRKEYAHTLTETRIPVGRMEINTIDHLVRIGGVSGGTGPDKKLPSLSDINCENETGTDGKGNKICLFRVYNFPNGHIYTLEINSCLFSLICIEISLYRNALI